MSCTSCGAGFGLLKKEVGCDICGFSFCTKCCSKKSFAEAGGELSKRVCNKCYESSSSSAHPMASCSPPLAYKKRMAKLSNRSLSLGCATDSTWTNDKDKEIAERLQKLKRERNKDTRPSQGEIEERLAKLKGMDPAKFTAPPIMVYRPTDKRSSSERADALMRQIVEEVQIDAKRERPEDEIAARLARLKGEPLSPKAVEETIVPSAYAGVESSNAEEMDIDKEKEMFASQYKSLEENVRAEICSLEGEEDYRKALKSSKKEVSDEEVDVDEDAEADLIVEKLLAVNMVSSEMDDPESLNGGPLKSPDDSEKKSGSDEEEFPWCIICTEDARMRCFGCDSDLYCMRCFKECHDSLDIKDHKTCPFLSPKKLG